MTSKLTGEGDVGQADRVTERQNDIMTVWQNSRAAKEPALVIFNTMCFYSTFKCNRRFPLQIMVSFAADGHTQSQLNKGFKLNYHQLSNC